MKVTDLINLGKKSLRMFDEFITEKNIKPPMRVYIRNIHTDIDITELGGGSRGYALEIIKKPDWAKIVFDFMEEKIRSMPEFKQLNESIVKRYGKNINKLAHGSNELKQSAFWIELFIQKLIYEKLEGSFSDDLLIEYAALFKSDLELSSLVYKYVYYLNGIYLETDSIKINDNVLIRKTKLSDLEYTKDIFSDSPAPKFMERLPSSILEVEICVKDENDYNNYVNRIFNSLRLYKLGSIYFADFISNKKTIILSRGPQRQSEYRNYTPFRKYTVKESEGINFVNFINVVEQKLNLSKEEKANRTLFISIERYNSSLLESIDIDRRLMTAVMGLESLFTLEKDRGENAFKLGIRVARLLGNLNFNAMKVRGLIEDAYDFRNKVVHGAYISLENRKKMIEIFPDVLNYLRISLVSFILNQDIGKNKVIEIIDQSTISDVQNEILKKFLNKGISEFRESLA